MARLAREAGDDFPEEVTAFREEMAVHGRYRKPCPECGSPVQRIAYAENEANYCAKCQTGGEPGESPPPSWRRAGARAAKNLPPSARSARRDQRDAKTPRRQGAKKVS